MFSKILIVIVVTAAVASASTCPPGGLVHNGKCFTVGATQSDWTSVRASCAAMGGDLATVRDAEENQALLDMAASVTIGAFAGFLWIGLNDKASEGNFVWADGSSSAYRNWFAGEPNNGVTGNNGDEGCTAFGLTGSKQWIDASCSDDASPICMFDLGCQEGFQMFDGHCYKTTDASANWADSRASCQSLGGDLVSIDSAEEQTFITDSFYSGPASFNLWTGLNDLSGNGFVWADGSSPSYTNWVANQPDNTNGNEHCVITIYIDTTTGLYPSWNDFNCDRNDNLYGLCEMAATEIITPMPSVAPTLAPSRKPTRVHTKAPTMPARVCGSEFMQFDGHCYKKGSASSNWADSRASCQNLGGDLVSIDSAEEQTFITDSFYSGPASFNLWTGLNDLSGNGFVWADGSSPSYTNWVANQPDNTNGNEHCVITIYIDTTTGLYPSWNDFNCDRNDNLYALCEVVPPTVESLGNTASCSEGVANGLSAQIMAEYASRSGVSFSAYDGQWVKCPGGKCSGFLQTEVSNALVATAMAKGAAISIYSDYRSSAEQYLLTRWTAGGLCGTNQQKKVTAPGTSRLATGRAINVKPSSLRGGFTSELLDHGFIQYKTNDPNYFEMGVSARNAEAEELKAFQALWNRNVPSFQIKINGKYDAATMYALANAPVNGW